MLGVILDSIEINEQHKKIFQCLNELSKTIECCVFTNQLVMLPEKNKFAIFQGIDALSHKGVLISTSLINTQLAINCITAKKKIYYIQKPEWPLLNYFTAAQLQKIFYNEELEFLVNNEENKMLIEKLFGKDSSVVPNWDTKNMENICQTFSH